MKTHTSSLGLPCFLLLAFSFNIVAQSVEKSAGVKLFEAGDYVGAIELLKKSNDIVDLNILGYAYERIGNEKDARNAFDRSFKSGYKEFSDGIVKRANFDLKNAVPEDKLSIFLEKHSARIVVTAISARKTLEMKGPSSKDQEWTMRAKMVGEVGSILFTNQMVYSARELDVDAKINNKPRARYTDSARSNGTQGKIELLVLFAADATIKGVIATQTLPHGLTEEGYLAASKIAFTPAQRAGKPVAVLKMMSYSFAIY